MIRDSLCHGIKLTLIKHPNMALTLSEHLQEVKISNVGPETG